MQHREKKYIIQTISVDGAVEQLNQSKNYYSR